MINAAKKTIEELDRIIERHIAAGATDAPNYITAVEELAKRPQLSVSKTTGFLADVARNRGVVSYKDVADYYKFENFSSVRFPLMKHLGEVMEHCGRSKQKPLTVLVVDHSTRRHSPDQIRGVFEGLAMFGREYPEHRQTAETIREIMDEVYEHYSGETS